MRYRSLSSILPWMVVHPASHKVSRVSWYSGYQPSRNVFKYGGLTLCAGPSHALLLTLLWFMLVLNPRRPKTTGLGSSLFARRYYGNLVWLLFLRLLRCFSSPGYPPVGWYDMTRTGLPHSEMYGSLPACGSPYLFAAYRVLHRLSMPRHPPYALCSLITFRNFTFKVNHTMIMLSVFVKVCYPKMSFLPH